MAGVAFEGDVGVAALMAWAVIVTPAFSKDMTGADDDSSVLLFEAAFFGDVAFRKCLIASYVGLRPDNTLNRLSARSVFLTFVRSFCSQVSLTAVSWFSSRPQTLLRSEVNEGLRVNAMVEFLVLRR